MKNKHKFWILIALILLIVAVAYSITPTNNNTSNLTNNRSENQQPIYSLGGLFGGNTNSNGNTESKDEVQTKECQICEGTGKIPCATCMKGSRGVFECKECGKYYYNYEGGVCEVCHPDGIGPVVQPVIPCPGCGGELEGSCENCGGDGKL